MARDINFTKISRRDIEDKQELIKSAVENKNYGIVDKNVDRRDIVEVSDRVFFNHVMMAFENNQKTNSCFFNSLKDRADSDFTTSFNVQLDPLNTCLKLEKGETYGEYYTRKIFSNYVDDSTMNSFYLIVDQDVPVGSLVSYYLITDKDEVFPIEANNKVALEIKDKDSLPVSVRLKAVISQGAGEQLATIRGMAILYNDDYVNSQIDIFSPDFDREVVETPEDLVTLFRDPYNDDVLVKVENSSEKIIINYDMNGELSSLDVYNIKNDRLKSKVDMIYENYENSQGETEKVLTKIRTRNSLTPREP